MQRYSVLKAEGRRIEFLFAGEPGTDPFFFLHGYNLRASTCAPFAKALLKESRGRYGQVIVPRLETLEDGTWRMPGRMDAYLGLVRTFIGAFRDGERRPYYLGGHSQGGAVALLYTLGAEEPPQAVIPINNVKPTDCSPLGLIARVAHGQLEETVHAATGHSRVLGTVVALDYVARALTQLPRFWAGLEDVAAFSWPEGKSDVPVYAIWGENDQVFQYERKDAEELRRLYPASVITTVPLGRHNILLRYPGLTARIIRRMIAGVTLLPEAELGRASARSKPLLVPAYATQET